MYIIPILVFVVSLVLIVWLISFRMWKLGKSTSGLQSERDWFRIDLIKKQQELDRGLKSRTRPHIRAFLYRVLRRYQRIVFGLRKMVRRRIQKTLHHYHEKNDPVPTQPQSKFIEDIKIHKEGLRQNGTSNGIHHDFPIE